MGTLAIGKAGAINAALLAAAILAGQTSAISRGVADISNCTDEQSAGQSGSDKRNSGEAYGSWKESEKEKR